MRLEMPQKTVLVDAQEEHGKVRLSIDGVLRSVGVVRRTDGFVVIIGGRNHTLFRVDPLLPRRPRTGAGQRVAAPLPAKVTNICVKVGDEVKSGAALIILEAMKMEIALRAPRDGVIEKICVAVGDLAPEEMELIVLAKAETA
jgi:3-methylcrotonyl-CoA carboxylase alpha subunit